MHRYPDQILKPQSRHDLRDLTNGRQRDAGFASLAPTESLKETLTAEQGLLERRYAIAQQYNEHGVCVFDRNRKLVLANDRYATIYGLSPEQIKLGMPLREVLELRIEQGVYGNNGAAAYKRERMRNVTQRRTRIQDLIDGRCILIVQQPIANGNWIATHEDISERLRTEAQVSFLATRDPLTGLSNRAALMARLTDALRRLPKGERICVMLIDLDNFKPVNDTYGHDVGDDVLKIVAARIRCHVRELDSVARLGGDEFVVIQSSSSDTVQITKRITRLINALAQPIVLPIASLNVGASAGVAIADNNHSQAEDILKIADLALYRAKNNRRGSFQIDELTAPAPTP